MHHHLASSSLHYQHYIHHYRLENSSRHTITDFTTTSPSWKLTLSHHHLTSPLLHHHYTITILKIHLIVTPSPTSVPPLHPQANTASSVLLRGVARRSSPPTPWRSTWGSTPSRSPTPVRTMAAGSPSLRCTGESTGRPGRKEEEEEGRAAKCVVIVMFVWYDDVRYSKGERERSKNQDIHMVI